MAGRHIIALDTHCEFCEMAVMSGSGRLIKTDRVITRIPELRQAIESVRRPREVVIEEGPLADWLFRNLRPAADALVVSEPRRNRLIAAEGDKDDPIDARKLAELYRGGYVKPVHHPEAFERVAFKQVVTLYHDRVRNRVRQANRIGAWFRQHGVFVKEDAFADPAKRSTLLDRWCRDPMLRDVMQWLWNGYDAAAAQVAHLQQVLERRAQREDVIQRFFALPGIGWIRASTFFVYVDTPWRFPSKSALWRYVGVGLERRRSGSGPTRWHVPRNVNRRLKSAVVGAAQTAINQGNNPFADQHERWVHHGHSPRTARRNVARCLTTVMWGMWKRGGAYRPEWVNATATTV